MNPPKPKKMGCKRMLGSTGFVRCVFVFGGKYTVYVILLYHGVLKDLLQDDDMLDDENKGQRSRKNSFLHSRYIKVHCTLYILATS